MTANYIEGKARPWTNNINLVTIGTSAIAGAVTSGTGAVESLTAKTAIWVGTKVATTVINNTVKVETSDKGLQMEVQSKVINIATGTAFDLGTDIVIGKVLGSTTENALSKVGVANAGRLSKNAKTVVRALGSKVTRSTTAAVKTGLKVVKTAASTGVESAAKSASNSKREKIKKSISE